VKWADIIDGAQYESAKTAIELEAPAMKLTLVIEGVKGSEAVQDIIRRMRCQPLDEIIQEPSIQQLYTPLYDRHRRSIDIIGKQASCRSCYGKIAQQLCREKSQPC
jgi:hypothetical protein